MTRTKANRQRPSPARVDALNADLQATFAQLRNILSHALSRDTFIDLEKQKTTARLEPFNKAKPRRSAYLPAPPSGMHKMLPWKKREFEQLVLEGEKRYERAERAYNKAKRDHQLRMNARRDKAFEQNQKIKRIQERFAAGESKAVEDYFLRVLHNSSYPASFPRKTQLVYQANSRLLIVERDLPAFEAVPDAKAYRYVKTRDEITQTALPQSQRKQLYASALAQIPLRLIYEIFTADRSEKIDTIIFSGFVNKVRPGTGKPGRFCLISVSTTRHQFLDLNLELVDPLECLKHLRGRLSRKPEDLIEVDPIDVIGDTKTPPTSSQGEAVVDQPRRADEIYRRVSLPAPESAPNDIPIPARAQSDSFRPSLSRRENLFVAQARKYINRSESSAEPVPFQQYWPTYESMDAAQQRWYFYWRAQLRQGNRLPTDLSYLFVHIYEGINLVGFESPADAFNHLDEFWRYYRQLQPKLDNYLPDWLADFIVLHGLAPDALAWYSEVSQVTPVTQLDIVLEAWLSAGGAFEALPDAALFALAKYNPTKSKFYKKFSESTDLRQGYKQALLAVDQATRRAKGKSLFQLHQPARKQVIRRAPFASAIHAYPATEIEIAATHAWTEVAALSATLNSIIKHADNVLRAQAGYSYRVRGIQLTDATKSLIEAALQPKAPKQELAIDHAKIAQLAKDSQAIRERLLADALPQNETPPTVEVSEDEQFAAAARWLPGAPQATPAPIKVADQPPSPSPALDWTRIGGRRQARATLRLQRFASAAPARSAGRARQSTQPAPPPDDTTPIAPPDTAPDNGADPAASGFLHRPDDTPADLLTDLAEVAHIMGASDQNRARLIAVLMANGWECPAHAFESAFPGAFPSVIIDEINSIALDEIGDTLIIEEDGLAVVLEEYRDEVEYILQHPQYLEQ